MGQYFIVNGDYNIKAKDGSKITLDPGTTGTVVIPGNLTVSGATTTVSSNDLDIKDRIITLNKGEAGSSVTLTYSGVEIDRGSGLRAAFVWNDTDPGISGSTGSWQIGLGTNGSYGFTDSNLKLRRILTDTDTDSGDLTLIGTGTGVVKVAGTTNYEAQVTDDDDIPNKKYVDDSIQNNPTFQIRKDDTRVLIADKDVTPNTSGTGGSLNYFFAQTSYTLGESGVGILVDGYLNTTFYSNRTVIQGLEVAGTEITNDGTNTNISIRTNGTGKLQTNYAIQLDSIYPISPASVSGSHVVYSGLEAAGKTGLYFATTTNRDELVSKNRALVFSMLF